MAIKPTIILALLMAIVATAAFGHPVYMSKEYGEKGEAAEFAVENIDEILKRRDVQQVMKKMEAEFMQQFVIEADGHLIDMVKAIVKQVEMDQVNKPAS